MFPRAFGGVTLAALALSAPLAGAQESTNLVAEMDDWSVFVEEDPQECWAVSDPQSTRNTRDGQEVTVQRGEILLFVSYRPEDDVAGEISFTGGYPFADGSTVSLEVEGRTFELFTEGQWAWPASGDEDAQILEAMRAGADAVVVGRSSRGTRTEDTFSLIGLTDATIEAEERCSG